jgi:feruloyl-CoA synthase
MDASSAPFRDPRYAARDLEVSKREDGGLMLVNKVGWSNRFSTTNGALDHWAKAAPERLFLAERAGDSWRGLTFAEFHGRVARLATALSRLGLGQDKPLLILARNSVDHALISYAAMRIGCPIAPLSPQYGTASADPARLAHAAALIRPGAIYVEDGEAALAAISRDEILKSLPVIASRKITGHQIAFNRLDAGTLMPDQARPELIAKLLLTSGSTGKPKAVICTHGNVSFNAAQIEACYNDPDPPVVVNAAPWSHSLGANAILHMVMHRGGTLYIDHGQPVAGRFGETLRNLHDIAPTYHNMVPAGWALFADALEADDALARKFFSRVRVIQYGGAGLPQSVCDRVQAAAVKACGERISFAAGYGSTETGPTCCNVHWTNGRAGLCGLPTPGTTIKLAPEGEKLEVRVMGPQISPGYRGPDGEVIPLSLDEEGYFRLGDAAKLADPADPLMGLVFDGRLVENFKLSTGTFVAAGSLRLAALSAMGGVAADAVVCGEGQEGVGLLIFLNQARSEALAPEAKGLESLSAAPAVKAAIRKGLETLNGEGRGGAARVTRALIQRDTPDAHSGELTDKGYINQALARTRRATDLERLYAAQPDPEVICL